MQQGPPQGPLQDAGTAWLKMPHFRVMYLFVLGVAAVVIRLFGLESKYEWTVISCFHNIVTWAVLHDTRGLPFDGDQGRFENFTPWDQLIASGDKTSVRNFLMAMPVILFLIVAHYTHTEMLLFLVNFATMILNVYPKFGGAMRRRAMSNSDVLRVSSYLVLDD